MTMRISLGQGPALFFAMGREQCRKTHKPKEQENLVNIGDKAKGGTNKNFFKLTQEHAPLPRDLQR